MESKAAILRVASPAETSTTGSGLTKRKTAAKLKLRRRPASILKRPQNSQQGSRQENHG